MMPFMVVPGRIAVILVATILLYGHMFRSTRTSLERTQASSQNQLMKMRSGDEPPAVPVNVYVESLCIDSKRFVLNSLVPTYEKLGPVVTDLNVVVFGNAKLDAVNRTIDCQHGVAECDANVYEQCATSLFSVQFYLPFIACLFETLDMGHRDEPFAEVRFQGCAARCGVRFDSLQKCHGAPPERIWEQQEDSAKLTPPHTYVPWVVVNGRRIDEQAEDLLQVVCREYTQAGGFHPACASQGHRRLR